MRNSNKKKIEVGLDLTKLNIKKFGEYIIEKSIEIISEEELKKRTSNVGLDLVNNKSGYKIDITKYGEDIN